MSGYTYYIVRTNSSLGTCERRKAAMEYLYHFYHSDTVTAIAKRYSFAVLPSFIRDIVVNKLVNSVLCPDGSFALAKYRTQSTSYLTSNVMASTLNVYMTVYSEVDNSVTLSATSSATSDVIWSRYLASPESYGGVFTVFGSSEVKRSMYLQASSTLTSSFTHFSVVALYHLNAFPSTTSLYLTSDILAGIFTGSIIYWNDSAIQQANSLYKQYLPYQRIIVVTQPNASDTNIIWSRFLSRKSTLFQETYSVSSNGSTTIPFHRQLTDSNYHIQRGNNLLVDDAVTHYDGSIGYYSMLLGVPNSNVAGYCHDLTCQERVYPRDGGISLKACENDPKTIIQPSSSIHTYDLMISNSTDCYPIAGTVDLTTYSQPNAATCSDSEDGLILSMTKARVKFAAWLFNGTDVTGPLSSYDATSSPSSVRDATYSSLCDIQCSSQALGYTFCSYRDCSWSYGDFYQVVSSCDSKLQLRKVSYLLNDSSTCLRSTLQAPASADIECAYVTTESQIGITSYIFCALGVIVCLTVLAIVIKKSHLKIMKKSQPVFVYIFIVGAICLNLTIIVYVGKKRTSYQSYDTPIASL